MQDSKNILFIAPLFFGYYKSLLSEMEEMGYTVDYVCDAPSSSNLSKALSRISRRLVKGAATKHFKRDLMPLIEEKTYQKVILLGGMTFSFTEQQIAALREKQPAARFVMYQWDSEDNLPYSVKLHKYFDRVFTFDRNDYNGRDAGGVGYSFLPLFYTSLYGEIGQKSADSFEYDCSYVGTAHPQKFRYINEMSAALSEKMPRQFIYHYMPSKLKYYYHKLTAKEYKKAKPSDFRYEKLSFGDMMQVFERSAAVLDSPQAGQTGLTIRTLECLGAKRKLVTANPDIVNYDFYRPENIYVYDGGEIDYSHPFFESPYTELPEEIYKKYSIRSFVSTLLETENEA